MTVVTIAGMHRSGTSMITRLLNLCGVYLGDESDLLPPNPDNMEGYWENRQFMLLNDEILYELGGGWDYPPIVDPWWEKSNKLSHLKPKASELIQKFSDHKLWGWKDPRNSLTLPFWKEFAPSMKVVICVRNPDEVFNSLIKRNYFSLHMAFNLWLEYNQRVLSYIEPENRIITHYDSYFQDPRSELRRILTFLDINIPDEQLTAAINTISTPSRHNRSTLENAIIKSPPEIIYLYQKMCVEAEKVLQVSAKVSVEQQTSFTKRKWGVNDQESFLRLLWTELAQKNEIITKKEQSVQVLSTQLAQTNRRLQELTSQLASYKHDLAQVRNSKLWKVALLFRRLRGLVVHPHNNKANPNQNQEADLALIQSSTLFDKTWYLNNNPNIAHTKIDPLLHYLCHGGFEGCDPGPNFSSKWYLDTYKDVKKTGINPLVHFLKYGKTEGRYPNLESNHLALLQSSNLFDKTWYLDNNPDISQAKIDPFLHYLRHGGFEGRDPGPNFSSKWYLDTYNDVKKAGSNPLLHYLKHGKTEGRKPHSHQTTQTFSTRQRVKEQEKVQVIQRDPIIVHQMGKVGSKTVELSLMKAYKNLGINLPIYHTHALNDFDKGKQIAMQEQGQRDPAGRLAALEYGENIRKQIDENPAQHWNIISLVRDPIARNIATFFHNLPEYIPDWYERYTNGNLSVGEIQALFLEISVAYNKLDDWFDSQMKSIPAFSIDVYTTPFPHEIGYKIYPGSFQASLLLIRQENLNECAEHAIHEFLGLENFTLHNTNIGAEKDYAELYRAFKEQPLPKDYVEKIYKTQFARHFYSDRELDIFTQHWTRNLEIENNILSNKVHFMKKNIASHQSPNTDLALIQLSGLFDEAWYLAKNPDVAQAKIDPLLHYLQHGGFEGRDPGPNFSSRWYLDTYEDIKKMGENPLVHFLTHGKAEGRHPNLESLESNALAVLKSSDLFDADWYLANNPDIADAKLDPLLHYLHHGGFEGRDPGPNFSSRWYLDTYEDIKKMGENPLIHFLKHGKADGRHPNLESLENDALAILKSSDLFDAGWYLANNPDIADAKLDPLLHYLRHGGFEGRDPGPNFSSRWYLDTYEDIKKMGENPLVHFLKHGKAEGRHPNLESLESNALAIITSSGLFDKSWYLAHNPDIAQANIDPLLHYLRHGGFEGRDPGPNFSSQWYFETHEDLKKVGVNPLLHYLQDGKFEGRKAQPENILQVNRNPTLVYTMGKVGSTTVAHSLLHAYNKIGTQARLRHAHFLNHLDQMVPKIISETEIVESKQVREEIDEDLKQHWNIITLVRDPVARNIAHIFHGLDEFIPLWRQHSTDDLISELKVWLTKSKIIDEIPNQWFDQQMKQIPAFEIDVYAEPFPKEIGYKIYSGRSRARLLLIRMENLNECVGPAMYEFLGLENFTLQNANIGAEKDYADLYQAFKKQPLPLDYIERSYNTQFSRHFYSDSELEAFTKRWTKSVELKNNRLANTLNNDMVVIKSLEDDFRLSGLFDEAWYLANNPDVARANFDPLLHYLRHGGFEGRDPSPNFSSQWYLDTYEDVKKSGMNPLTHYLRYGKAEGRLKQTHQIGLTNHSCTACERPVTQFLPLPSFYKESLQKYGWPYTFDDAETINADQYNCPHCGATDRDRLYAIYLNERINNGHEKYKIFLLDIAPSPALSDFINRHKNIVHHTVDLLMEGVDFVSDITNMPEIASNIYDILICSHVLEHVGDDKKALSELYRVLKPGGWGIIMVPIVLAIDEIDEDPRVTDVAERWRRFGQDDHVRLYSKSGFVRRVEASGFTLKQLGVEYFGEFLFQKYGITKQSILYIAEKPLSAT